MLPPSGCSTAEFAKRRMTCISASASATNERNALPSPSPLPAPRESPARSTNSTCAGVSLRGACDFYERVKALVRHRHDGLVRVRLASRVGLDLRPGPRDYVEDCALAAQRQSDNSAMQHLYQLQNIFYFRHEFTTEPSARQRRYSKSHLNKDKRLMTSK